jgi:integrase
VAKKGRRPAYRDLEDARALLRETEAAPGHPVTKLASRLLALTLVRPGVLRSAPWNGELKQLDGKEPLWWIPAERMKLGLERKQDDTYDHLVPLSRQAVEVILAVKMLTGRGPLMFPNLRNAHEPMSENAIGYMYNRILGVRGRHVPHGWRATFSTIMNERAELLERPADRAIIDLMLAHVPDNIEGAYNRAAYMPRRRQIAQEWADMLLDGFPPAESLLKRFRS